jgi:hypothetical protein
MLGRCGVKGKSDNNSSQNFFLIFPVICMIIPSLWLCVKFLNRLSLYGEWFMLHAQPPKCVSSPALIIQYIHIWRPCPPRATPRLQLTMLNAELYNLNPLSNIITNSNFMVWVRERTIPTERPPLIGEVIANFLRIECATWSAWRIPTAVFSVF